MTAFNRKNTRPAVFSPIKTNTQATTRTYNGAPGFERDAKSDLFLLAAGSFFGQDAFYESGNEQADRFRALVSVNTGQDPAWTARFLAWLRGEGNIRTGAIVGAVEYARTLQEIVKAAGGAAPLHEDITARAVVRSVLQRADEPGEMLAYYTSRYGRSVPIAIKRGIADAIVGHRTKPLYTEYNMLKYDTAAHGFRFGDVVEIVHPTGEHPGVKHTPTAALLEHALVRRHGREGLAKEVRTFPMLLANTRLRKYAGEEPELLLDSHNLKTAGFTWEDALSLAGDRVDKARLWEALIPNMGYMARLRNLRNFDQAGVSDAVALRMAVDLADPEKVRHSRQLPMRFLSAYRAAPSLRWGYALETALDLSLQNVPELKGRTLILVDTSGSMGAPFSKDGTLKRWDAAVVFGLALARRAQDADVVSYSSGGWGAKASVDFPQRAGESLLKSVERWQSGGYFIGSGTDTAGAVQRHYRNHDRVVILTDEQADYHGYGDVTATVPQDRMVYTFNLAGYSRGHAPSGSGTRHTFGGLTDAGFQLISRIEANRNGEWPF
jgi:hypothetical protein